MAFDISLSGIRAQTLRLDVTAHNLANASTPGFSEYRAELAEAPAGKGVQPQAVVQTAPPAAPDAPADVDLAGQLVEMISAQRGVEANVRMIQAEDAALDSLLEDR